MRKSEIADDLGVSLEDIHRWADRFAEWLDVDSQWIERNHSEDDIRIFSLISMQDKLIDKSVPFQQRVSQIENYLFTSSIAIGIRQKHQTKKSLPQIRRWQIVSASGISLQHDYDWLNPLRASVNLIANFGCWATEGSVCSEPFALLWTLEADKVVVIEINPQHVRYAQEWLVNFRQRHTFFSEYDLEFIEGDIREKNIDLKDDSFDLSFCHNVLYNMQDSHRETQDSVKEMSRVVKPGGWVIAIEPKYGTKVESQTANIFGEVSIPIQVPIGDPADISNHFKDAGLIEGGLSDIPNRTYCYKKPLKAFR